MKHRVGRVEGEILRELTKILRKDIRDPRLSEVTITAVECTNDLSYATIYYSLLTEDAEKEKDDGQQSYFMHLCRLYGTIAIGSSIG